MTNGNFVISSRDGICGNQMNAVMFRIEFLYHRKFVICHKITECKFKFNYSVFARLSVNLYLNT